MVALPGDDRPSGHEHARMVVLGRIAGVFGVQGWVKVYSHTAPVENILNYSPWFVADPSGWREFRLVSGKRHSKGVVASLEGCADRDQAAALHGRDIAVPRGCLPDPEADEFYWADLEGLRVETTGGRVLGTLSHLFDTGANDVMVVKGDRERLIPYLWNRVVKRVDIPAGVIQVDWDADF